MEMENLEIPLIIKCFFRDIKMVVGSENNLSGICCRCFKTVIAKHQNPTCSFMAHLLEKGHEDLIAMYMGICYEDRPIFTLFKSLVSNDYNQQMTNKEILNILQKELSIDITNTHELEVEIYMNVVKKFLKDWPDWNDFEQAVNDLRAVNDNEALMSLLEEKSISLKNYLSGMLDIARLQLPEYMAKLPIKQKTPEDTKPSDKPSSKDVKEHNIVMEVQATRSQLNNLFLRHPIGNNNIFNVNEPNEDLIVSNVLSLDSILNSPGVSVEIRMRASPHETFFFKYENIHEIRLKLVNRNLNMESSEAELSQEWQVKCRKKKEDGNIHKEKVLDSFKSALNHQTREWKELFVSMHQILRDLVENMPQIIYCPAIYRRYLSKYSYVRYLYSEHATESADEKYDIQMEEIISPRCLVNIGYFPKVDSDDCVRIHCTDCKFTAEGMNMVRSIKDHFLNCHSVEQDWSCMSCKQNFSTANLMQMNWIHTCSEQDPIPSISSKR